MNIPYFQYFNLSRKLNHRILTLFTGLSSATLQAQIYIRKTLENIK